MSQKLQWLFGGFRQTPLFRVYSFFLGFFLSKALLGQVMTRAFLLFGWTEGASLQATENNEIFIQSFALLISWWLVFGKASLSALGISVGEALSLGDPSTFRARRMLHESMKPAVRAFALATATVTLCLLFGVFRIEGPVVDLSWLGYWAPLWFLKAASFFLWVLILEMTRNSLMKVLLSTRETEFVGRLALVLFEGYLIFKIFRLPGDVVEQALVALVAVWIASLLQLWTGVEFRRPLVAWRRTIFMSTFLISMYGIYGLPFSWGRNISVYSTFVSPHSGAMASLFQPYLLSNVIFIVLLTLLSWRMLRRVQLSAS